MGQEETAELGDFISSEKAAKEIDSALDFVDNDLLNEIIMQANLTPRERYIIAGRFALNSTREVVTSDALGESFGVSGQAIRKQQQTIMRKLRTAAQRIELKEGA